MDTMVCQESKFCDGFISAAPTWDGNGVCLLLWGCVQPRGYLPTPQALLGCGPMVKTIVPPSFSSL
jgi:hypothetical protein